MAGPPGYGKSTFARAVAEGLASSGWLVAHAELRMVPSAAALAAELARALFCGVVAPAEKAWTEVVGAVGALGAGPRLQIDRDGGLRFEYPHLSQAQLRAAIHELLALADDSAARSQRRCLLVVDELPETRAFLEDADDLLVAAAERAQTLRILGLGIEQALLEATPGARSGVARAWGPPAILPPLDLELIRQRIGRRAEELGFACTSGVLSDLALRLDGHPRATSLVCRELLGRAGGRPSLERIGRAAVEHAWEAALAREESHHLALWRMLRPQKKAVLVALSIEGQSPYSEAYRSRHGLGSASAVQKALLALAHAGFAWQRDSGGWAVIDPLLRDFLRRAAGAPARPPRGIHCG